MDSATNGTVPSGTTTLLPNFRNEYAAARKHIDVFCAWNFRHGMKGEEEQAFLAHCPNAYLTDIRAQDFLANRDNEPWTAALEGKRVLVVHPLASQIHSQYQNREALFPGTSILPRFSSLACLEAVQSAAGSTPDFSTWFDALEYMKCRMNEVDFDVALIGAGAYGLPLAAHARRSGRSGIHLGGISQLLFEIMGRRWESKYAHYLTPAWTRPDAASRPPGFDKVEDGCYW